MQNIKNNMLISVAGTVGIGKSTLTKKLAEKLNFKTSFEVVDSNPYLGKYYDDFERWGFHLQIFFLAERFKEQKRIFEYGGGFIQDRTIYEDLEIFAKMNNEKGTMSDEDYQTYQELFEAMVLSPFFDKPDLVIYLEGSLERILDRLKIRGREMELSTDIQYWEELFERYEYWISHFNHTPLLRLNIDEYDVDDEETVDEIVKKIDKILGMKLN